MIVEYQTCPELKSNKSDRSETGRILSCPKAKLSKTFSLHVAAFQYFAAGRAVYLPVKNSEVWESFLGSFIAPQTLGILQLF